MKTTERIVSPEDRILVTGANGFIGSRVVESLMRAGFYNLRLFIRSSNRMEKLDAVLENFPQARVEIVTGNLLSPDDCRKAVDNVAVIYHLAAASQKSFAGSFMNCVVTTRNLMRAAGRSGCIRRFVHVSSFAVYSNEHLGWGAVLDESCETDPHILERSEAYAYAKLRQEELVIQYGHEYQIPYVILRPGSVYGPGAPHLSGRIGIDTFGVYFHLGGNNQIPLTYVDNCAQAIMLAGLRPNVDGEVFNVVDDELPTSRKFLSMYKKQGHSFPSIRIPYWLFYSFSWFWEAYSRWSEDQLPPVFNRNRCRTYWKGNRYSNRKLKDRIGWQPEVPFQEAARRYFADVRERAH